MNTVKDTSSRSVTAGSNDNNKKARFHGLRRGMTAVLLSSLLLPTLAWAIAVDNVPLQHANINLHDQDSLQRGAKYFMNYCSGCHSLKYMRYSVMARDIGIVDLYGKVDKSLVEKNLIFTDAKIGDLILTSMSPEEATQFFGIDPPDLSLKERERGADWIYTFLLSFYEDSSKSYGTNNWLFPDVAMPNILENLQGRQIPVTRRIEVPYRDTVKQVDVIDHLRVDVPGSMTEQQFRSTVNDIVNFLTYVSEPQRDHRRDLGWWVISFLILFTAVAYLLKREFWKNIH